MNHRRTVFFTVILALIISLSCWIALLVASNLLHERAISAQNPDFFMNNVVYSRMSVTGEICQQIIAPRVVHYPNNDESRFTQPHLLVFNQTQKLWDINADEGKSIAHAEQIDLSGNVNIERLPTPYDFGFTVQTTFMRVFPDTRTAHTDEPVTILQNGSTVHAVGADADLALGTINLLSKVHGDYQNNE